MTDYFSYNSTCDLPPDSIRIAPSQLSRFFDATPYWYRENLLGEAPAFTGSTASELGTVVHAAAHMYHDTGQVDRQAIENYISSLTDPEIDKYIIREQWPIMVETLITDYLVDHPSTDAELFVPTEIRPSIYLAGTIDAYCSKTSRIRDFKTMGSLDTARLPKSFPRSYWFQQFAYALAMTKAGHRVDFIDLVYVTRANVGRFNDKGKALKDYPSQVHVLTEEVTTDKLEMIEGIVQLVAESIQHWQAHPEHRYLLAQDYRLKVPEKRPLFKD